MTHPLHTTVRVLAVETSHGRMDSYDDARLHVWLACEDWSTRRAFLTGGDEFFRALLRHEGLGERGVSDLLDGSVISMKMLPGWAKMLVGRCFYAQLMAPDAVAEPGERIEISAVSVCSPLEELNARLMADDHL